MATLEELRKSRNDNTETPNSKPEASFTRDELDFLLQLIANSTFEGKDVSIVYHTALKIQNLLQK